MRYDAPVHAKKTYIVLKKLAEGGMAEVVLAYSPLLREPVVLKQLKRGLAVGARDLFLREARILRKINHPNIVRLYNIFDLPGEGELCIEMEWLRGRTLEQLLLEVPPPKMPVEIACRIIHDACLALHAAHEARDGNGQRLLVVHRDVKPSNVMVEFTGTVKVIDFGLARSAKNSILIGQGEGFTPGYLAPERAAEILKAAAPLSLGEEHHNLQSAVLDGRSDLFSVGVMLFEVLTGKKLFQLNPEVWVSLSKQIEHCQEVIRCEVDRRGLPLLLEPIVLKALARKPEDRFANCLELAQELARVRALASHEQVAAFIAENFPGAKEAEDEEVLQLAAEKLKSEAGGGSVGETVLFSGAPPVGASSGEGPVEIAPPVPAPRVEPPLVTRQPVAEAPAAASPREAPITKTLTGTPEAKVGVPGPSGTLPWHSAAAPAAPAPSPTVVEEAPQASTAPVEASSEVPKSGPFERGFPVTLGGVGPVARPQEERQPTRGWAVVLASVAVLVAGAAIIGPRIWPREEKGPITPVVDPPPPPVVTREPPKPSETLSSLEMDSPKAPTADGRSRVAVSLTLQVRDDKDQPMQDVPVLFVSSEKKDELRPASVRTDQDGRAYVRLATKLPGKRTVTATINSDSKPMKWSVVVTFERSKETVVTPKITLEAATPKVLADGTAKALLRVALTRPDGKPMPNRHVRLFANVDTVVPNNPQGVLVGRTDNNGRVEQPFTSKQAGPVEFTAILDSQPNEQAVMSEAAVVTFTPGPPDPQRSFLQPARSEVRAGEELKLDVELRDANGNLVPFSNLEWEGKVDGRVKPVYTRALKVDGKGTATALLKPMEEGRMDITATVSHPHPALSLSREITVKPWPVASVSLSASRGEAPANGSTPITLQVETRDTQGKPVVGRGITLQFSQVGGASPWPPITLTTDSQGKASHPLTSPKVMEVRVTASVESRDGETGVKSEEVALRFTELPPPQPSPLEPRMAKASSGESAGVRSLQVNAQEDGGEPPPSGSADADAGVEAGKAAATADPVPAPPPASDPQDGGASLAGNAQ